MGALTPGRCIEILTVVEHCTKEAIDLAVDFGISGHYVTRILDQVVHIRGYTKAIRTEPRIRVHWQGFQSMGNSERGTEHTLVPYPESHKRCDPAMANKL